MKAGLKNWLVVPLTIGSTRQFGLCCLFGCPVVDSMAAFADAVVGSGLVWCLVVDPVGCFFAGCCRSIEWLVKWVNVVVWWVDAVDFGKGFRALLVVS